jgi:hypothetical protein
MKISYPAPNAVSVWIGNFTSEADFDRCVDGPISKALNLKTPLASVCEICFEEEALPLCSLIEGFSGWTSFVDQAVEAARARGIEKANAALVCYYVKCEDVPAIWDTMQFLGSLAGRRVS